MNEFDYLEYEYYDAQAKWQTASREGRSVLRDQLIQLSRQADREPTADGLRLADALRKLAATIDEQTVDEQLQHVRRFTGVSEEFHLTYEHIRRHWQTGDESAKLQMLAQLTQMGQRRDIDHRFLLELTTLHGEIRAALRG